LAAQNPVLVESLLPAAERVATGETPIAITYVKYAYIYGHRGAPLDYVRLGKMMGDGHYLTLGNKAPHPNAGKALIDFFLGQESMSLIAKLGEFVNRKGVYPPLPDADKIQFVEMYDLDSKQFAEKKKEYQQIFVRKPNRTVPANERILTAEPGFLSTTWSRTRVGSFLSQPISWVFLIVGGTIAFLSLYPTFFLFYGSVMDAPLGVPGHFTLQNYVKAFGDPKAFPLLLNSFIFGLGAAGLSVIFALALAWITIRTNAPFRRLFELTAIIPNILPPILVSISWVMLLNPSNGLINGLFVKVLGLAKGPFNIYSMAGLIFVEALILTPLAFLIIAAALKSMDPSLEESAKTLGSGELGVMSRITFPLMRPAILAAATLNFVRAVESFDTPAIIALPARIEVFTTKIWREALGSFPTNHNLAATYGVGILMIALLFVYLYRRFTSQVESFSTVTGKGFRPHQIDLGKWKYLASAVAFLLLLLLVVLPIL